MPNPNDYLSSPSTYVAAVLTSDLVSTTLHTADHRMHKTHTRLGKVYAVLVTKHTIFLLQKPFPYEEYQGKKIVRKRAVLKPPVDYATLLELGRSFAALNPKCYFYTPTNSTPTQLSLALRLDHYTKPWI